jgi:tetratricopeptide (TPR) repeat protein
MSRRDRREGAQTSEETPGGSTAVSPAALHVAGIAHMQAGRYLEAQGCCKRALAVDSGHSDSLHLMGLLSLQAAQYDHAVEWIFRAIRLDPKVDYLASLGTARDATTKPSMRSTRRCSSGLMMRRFGPPSARCWKKRNAHPMPPCVSSMRSGWTHISSKPLAAAPSCFTSWGGSKKHSCASTSAMNCGRVTR